MSNPATSASVARERTAKAGFGDYLELTKPRLSLLSILTAAVGYAVARAEWDATRFVFTMLGTSLCAAGVAALNQWMETDTDARMVRTADRPLPSGRVATGSAFILGWGLCASGLAVLFKLVNGSSALFALLTIISYLALYTPAKRYSRWSTEIGAVAGAFPPLIGWAAAEPASPVLGWILFGILLFWQIPHFMAIAWIYRRDYAAVGFPMLPVRDANGRATATWSLINTFLVVACSALPWVVGQASAWYLAVTLLLGTWFVWRALMFLAPASREPAAKRLFLASILWLPLQLGALVSDRLIFF